MRRPLFRHLPETCQAQTQISASTGAAITSHALKKDNWTLLFSKPINAIVTDWWQSHTRSYCHNLIPKIDSFITIRETSSCGAEARGGCHMSGRWQPGRDSNCFQWFCWILIAAEVTARRWKTGVCFLAGVATFGKVGGLLLVGQKLRLEEIFAHPKWLSKCTGVDATYHKLRKTSTHRSFINSTSAGMQCFSVPHRVQGLQHWNISFRMKWFCREEL